MEKKFSGVGDVIGNILKSFDGMMRQTIENDPDSIGNASAKITKLVKNIAFPQFITNDTQLDDYYAEMDIYENDTYFEMRDKLNKFNFKLAFRDLVDGKPVQRDDFSGPPGTVNAWYQVTICFVKPEKAT